MRLHISRKEANALIDALSLCHADATALRLRTRIHNAMAATKKGGRTTRQLAFNAEQLQAIRTAYAAGSTLKQLAEVYGVVPSTIFNAVKGSGAYHGT